MTWRSRLTHRLAAVGFAAASAVLASGCSGSASLTPAAPSSLGTPSTSATGATISGQVNGGSTASLASVKTGGSVKAAPLTVTVAGTSVGTTTDPQGRFTLTGVPSGTIELVFSGGGVNATLTISGVTATDEIEIVVTLSGSTARVESEQRRQGPPAETPNHQNPNRVTVNGRIASLNPTARTFVVEGTTVSVPLTATIRHGSRHLLFSDLTVGAHVEVKGAWEGTLFVASEVKAQQLGPAAPEDGEEEEEGEGEAEDGVEEEEDDADGGRGQARLSGTMSGRTGTCPMIAFTVQGTQVRTDGDTRFRRVTCAALAAGASVEVMGTRQANGSVLARSVELEN